MEQNNNEKYDLYTEHIVPDTGEKIKRGLKKGAMVAVMAIFFGLVAGLVMIIVYHKGIDMISEPTKEEVKLPNDYYDNNTGEDVTVSVPEYTEEEATTQQILEWDEHINDRLSSLNESYGALRAVAARVNEYAVTVTKESDTVSLQSDYYNVNESFGLVMAEDSTYYYILTDAFFVNDRLPLKVQYSGRVSIDAEYVQSDKTTGLAVIRTFKEGLSDVKIAALGNSDLINKGDIVVAVGELYGFTNSMGYGIVTGSGYTISDTDTEFTMISTDIVGSESSFGVIANLNGEVVGIITTNYNSGSSNHVMAYSIQELTNTIERLMNGKVTTYFGIKGQAVTNSMADNAGYPKGIYVTSVETNSPAYYAGIQPGDVITAVNNNKIYSMDKFKQVLFALKENTTVDIAVQRKGRGQYKEIVFSAVLGVE